MKHFLININPKKILKTLIGIIFILSIGNLMSIFKFHFNGYIFENEYFSLLNFDTEKNIPTAFSTFILWINSYLFYFIFKQENNIYWLLLSFIFLFLGFDEAFLIHERLTGFFRQLLLAKNYFYYTWIIPYGIAVIILVAIYFNFLLNLPKRILFLYGLSATIFLLGAIGMEMIGGHIDYKYGSENLKYSISYSIEETLEMLGLSLLTFVNFSYIRLKSLIKHVKVP